MHMTKTAQIFRRLRRAGHTIAASQRTYATGLNRPPHAGCPRATHRRTGPVVDAGAPISPIGVVSPVAQWDFARQTHPGVLIGGSTGGYMEEPEPGHRGTHFFFQEPGPEVRRPGLWLGGTLGALRAGACVLVGGIVQGVLGC